MILVAGTANAGMIYFIFTYVAIVTRKIINVNHGRKNMEGTS